MKKAILMATFMLSTVSFANETKGEGILPKNEKITDAVTHENLEESLGFCFTVTYVYYVETIEQEFGFGLAGVITVREEVRVSDACTTCVSASVGGFSEATITCWGCRFPPSYFDFCW